MSQEYTKEYKDIALKKPSRGRRLLDAVLVAIGIFTSYLVVALANFSLSDASWSRTALHSPMHNLDGGIGLWFADTLFCTFGILAYALPPIMLFFCWNAIAQQDKHDYIDLFDLSLRLIGSLALLLASCGLAALNVDDLYYFASGGVIGSLLSNAIMLWFNGIGATLALLCVWVSGLTLFTGWSWLTVTEKIGEIVLWCLIFVSSRSRRDDEGDNGSRRSCAAHNDESEVAQGSQDLVGPAILAYPQDEQSSYDLLSTQVNQVLHCRFELPSTSANSHALSAEDDNAAAGRLATGSIQRPL